MFFKEVGEESYEEETDTQWRSEGRTKVEEEKTHKELGENKGQD